MPFLRADYDPKGEEIKIGDMDAYVIGSGEKAIVVAYDVHGFNGGRTRSVCDQLANEGYLVVLPDFFRGSYWNLIQENKSFETMGDWLRTMPYEPGLRTDFFNKVLPFLKERGVTSIGMAGFCWGAWMIFNVAKTEGAIACGVSFHPSLKVNFHFGGTEEDMAQGVTCPQLLLPAGNDTDAVREGGSVMAILQQSSHESVHRHSHAHSFPDMLHGYASRGANNLDLADEKVRRDVQASFKMAVDYFREHV